MGQVIIQRNPLNAALNETVEHEGPLIDWVVERFPAGFPAKTLLIFNGSHLEIRDMDRVVGPEDEVYLLMEPGAPVAAWVASVGVGALLAQAAVGTALSFGLSMVSNWLRGTPDADPGQGERETPSPTYSLTIPTNRARLGEALPVVYGTVKTVPDIVSQPYRSFVNNLPYPEYVFMLVAIGRGEHSFNREDIYIGDSSIGSREDPMQDATIIDYKSFPPDRHNNSFGTIQHNCYYANDDGEGANDGQPTGSWQEPQFNEDVETSVEIDNQELRSAIIVGNYVANRAGSSTRTFYVDVEFPNGLYALDDDYPGQLFGTSVSFSVYTRQIDDDGNDIGPDTSTWNFTVGAIATAAPVRYTVSIPGGAGTLPYGRYRVSMRRSTADSASNYLVNRSHWTGLRAVLHPYYENGDPVPEYQDCYEGMHLVAFRIKATEGIARDAANRISINATRQLDSGGATDNPAYIMYDMFTNTTYGAGRPGSELDTDKLTQIIVSQEWDNIAGGFNAVYDQATSVWPAMQQALRLVDATPVIYGGVVTVSEDKAGVAQHTFDEATIVDGSVSTTYSLNDTTDYDCYEVEYLDTESYIPRYSRFPTDGTIPLQVRYFGCTNEDMAAHQAQFLWFKRTFRRKRVSFQTEALGNIPLVGDKMYVQHPVVSSSGGENYIVETVAPEGQFSVTIQGIVDNFIYSDIPSKPVAAQLPAPDAEEDA